MIPSEELEKKTDSEIVDLVLEDQEYFLCVVKRYKEKLYKYIRRISNIGAEEAEDVLQNVFIKAYQNLNDFDKSLKFSSWIYRITHNAVIDNHRKIQSRPKSSGIDMDDDRVKELAHDFDITKELDNKYLREQILKAMDNLDIKHRDVLVLKFLEEKDYKEISDIIKKPQGTVASRINKAKKELKKELEKIKI